MEYFNEIQKVKRQFYAMRNGITADYLRANGSPYEIIFGLNLPQINEIANQIGMNYGLAITLRKDSRTRESQLLSSQIISPELITKNDALEWIAEMRAIEAIDITCMKLLKNISNPVVVAEECLKDTNLLMRYGGLRLLWNIYREYPKEAYQLATIEKNADTELSILADRLLEEIDFLNL